MTRKALGGVKILEYCDTISGAYCTKLMADIGAEVIKIEAPGTGDGARRKPPFPNNIPHPEKSGLFLYLNTNKFGITLDPATPPGSKIFRKLVADADILVEDQPPGEMEKLGLEYNELKKLNPGLIVVSLTPFGRSGPYKDYKAYQLNISHMSGQGYLLPFTDPHLERPPVKVGGNSGNFDPGLVAVIPVLAALFWKGKTGQGQFIEVSKLEALISMQRVESASFPNSGISMTRKGFEREASFAGIVPCKDGYVAMVSPEEHQQKALMKLIGRPDLAEEIGTTDGGEIAEHTAKTQKLISKWMKEHTKEEIFRKGQALSVPVAPINSSEDIVKSRQFNARNFFVEMQHPVAGKIDRFPSRPYRFSKTPWALERPAPLLGQHNEMIYCERLGYSKENLEQLTKTAVI